MRAELRRASPGQSHLSANPLLPLLLLHHLVKQPFPYALPVDEVAHRRLATLTLPADPRRLPFPFSILQQTRLDDDPLSSRLQQNILHLLLVFVRNSEHPMVERDHEEGDVASGRAKAGGGDAGDGRALDGGGECGEDGGHTVSADVGLVEREKEAEGIGSEGWGAA